MSFINKTDRDIFKYCKIYIKMLTGINFLQSFESDRNISSVQKGTQQFFH